MDNMQMEKADQPMPDLPVLTILIAIRAIKYKWMAK